MSEDKVFVKYRNTKRPEENEDTVKTLIEFVSVLIFENEMRDKDNQIDLNQAIEQIRSDKFVLSIGFASTTVSKEKQP